MTLDDISNYWWYKITNNKNSIDYVPYKANSRDEANTKIERDVATKNNLWPFYFSANKSYRRQVKDIISYKACSWHEVQFVAREKRKEEKKRCS